MSCSRVRALHLHDDLLARLERRRVHLADRSGCERLRIDRREDVLPRHAELLLHHADDLLLAERRDGALQLRELVDHLGRDQVGPRREDLAELRERRPELLERASEAAARVRRWSRCRRASRAKRASTRAIRVARFEEAALRSPAVGGGSCTAAAGRVDDHDVAASAVRDPVRDVVEQELPAPAHAGIPDDEQVGALVLGGAHDRRGRCLRSTRSTARARERRGLGVEQSPRLRRPSSGTTWTSTSSPLEPFRELRRPRHRLAGGLGAVGCDDDLHGSVFHQQRPWGARGTRAR